MGIKNLNRYLLQNCKNKSIQKKHLEFFRGKTIVIDTSIYLYKYAETGELIKSMHHMISVLIHYKIKPIFIFDGKPPKEKSDMLKKRRLEKQTAENKYNNLKLQLETNDSATQESKKEIQQQLSNLKKKFVRIQSKDIESVKELLISHNIQHIVAEGEADSVCASMVIQKKAWACMSDDTDMFVYGCIRIMRNFDLPTQTIMLYNINGILKELSLTLQEFREIIVLSGTDYNLHQKISLYKALNLHKEYKKSQTSIQNTTFYEWLFNNTSERILTEERSSGGKRRDADASNLRSLDASLQKLHDIYCMFDIRRDVGGTVDEGLKTPKK